MPKYFNADHLLESYRDGGTMQDLMTGAVGISQELGVDMRQALDLSMDGLGALQQFSRAELALSRDQRHLLTVERAIGIRAMALGSQMPAIDSDQAIAAVATGYGLLLSEL